jgi:REP element-mobilizing transposase RayT
MIKMPRTAREKSESGIYHIMLRGINRQIIFEDDEDREKFIETLFYYKHISKYELFGYCLMDNHVHLLIKESAEPISIIIKRISSSFVYWYNRKYERCGHLLQERFKSEIVENETYFLTVLRYIHQNPIKAGLSKKADEYKWSSAKDYSKALTMVNIIYALGLFSEDRTRAVLLFNKHMNEQTDDKCMENDRNNKVKTDQEVRLIFTSYGIGDISGLKRLESSRRSEIIRTIKKTDGITIRQLARITGISKSLIDRI